MSSPREWAAPAPPVLAGSALLERAVAYTRTSLQLVASTSPQAPTPCDRWDLLALLRHMDDSLAAFTDAADIGYVDLAPVPAHDASDREPERVAAAWSRCCACACALLAAWAHHSGGGDVSVCDRGLRSDLLAAAGSLEIAVHGWDVAQACGVDRPLPAALALELLDVVPLFVSDADRPARFAQPVDVPLHSRPSTRLLAALGRRT